MGQLANHLGERDKGKLPSQPVRNPKVFLIRNSSNPAHVQAIVTLRSRRQVDNQVVELEEDLNGQEGEKSGNKEEKDVEPSIATPIVKILLGHLYLKCLILRDYKCLRKEGSLRTFWRCSSRSKSISHFWTPSNKYLHMPSS